MVKKLSKFTTVRISAREDLVGIYWGEYCSVEKIRRVEGEKEVAWSQNIKYHEVGGWRLEVGPVAHAQIPTKREDTKKYIFVTQVNCF